MNWKIAVLVIVVGGGAWLVLGRWFPRDSGVATCPILIERSATSPDPHEQTKEVSPEIVLSEPFITEVSTMSNLIQFNDADFEAEVLQATGPVLVDFWAPWCGPCRALGPVIEALANENVNEAKVGKLNVDENPAMAAQLKVSGIPTVIIFKDGEVVARLVGLQSKEQIQAAIDRAKG